MQQIKLEKLDPEDWSDIKVEYFGGSSSFKTYNNIFVIKYIGKHGVGAAGNGDAQDMYAKGEFGLDIFEPSGVILDFQELDYVWGDMLELVFDVGAYKSINIEFPKALVIGDNCAKAIGTLIHGIDSKESATTKEWIFDNFEEAWRYVDGKISKKSFDVLKL